MQCIDLHILNQTLLQSLYQIVWNIDYTKSVTGVAYSKDDAKITIIGVEDKPGVAANIFEPLSKAQVNVDMVIQNISIYL